ncbi:MAG: hypothetical protein ACOX4P_00555 [Anaerovoracaceae bacterium]|jgi:hypothetical protein
MKTNNFPITFLPLPLFSIDFFLSGREEGGQEIYKNFIINLAKKHTYLNSIISTILIKPATTDESLPISLSIKKLQ